MGRIYNSITELVGNTPLVRLHRYEKAEGLKARILAKFEYFNPTGSLKDRAALNIIKEAEYEGRLRPGMTLVDYTSGNTGIAEAAFANALGYKFAAVIQPMVSEERSQILRAMGAQLLQITDVPGLAEMRRKGLDMEKLVVIMTDFANSRGWFYLKQCADPANFRIHTTTTGPELWEDTEGHVDYSVQLVGTAGTLAGLSAYLRKKNPDVKIIGAQPAAVSIKNPEFPERNTIDGVLKFHDVGEHLVPTLIKQFRAHYDECLDVVAEDAYDTGRKLVRTEGFFVGQSSGAALWAATQIARRPEAEGKNIVCILADNAFKYLSTNMYK